MNFWVLSPNTQNAGNVAYWLERTKSEGKAFIGYDGDKKHGDTFANVISIGDCIIVAQGSGDIRKLYYAGLVKSARKYDENDEVFYRDYEILVEQADFNKNGIKLDSNNAWGSSSNPGTIYQLKTTTEADNTIIHKLIKLFNVKMKNKEIEDKISILKTCKPQIILQGPPGTGKTFLAKEIARKMIEPKNITGSLNEINNFFKNFDSGGDGIQLHRKELNDLIGKFQNKFAIQKLKDISLDSYCIGKGTNDSFCWWIERGLRPLGSYSPGNSKSYQIYWDKAIHNYSLHGVLLSGVDDANEAIKLVGEVLYNVIMSKDINQGTSYFGDSFLLKILNSYYPNEFFPINSRKCLGNTLKLIGEDPTGKEKLEMNQRLVQLLNSKNKEFSKDVTPFEFMDFLFRTFELHGDIAFESKVIYAKGEYKLIQFHPAYTYEDFVRGIVAKTSSEDKVYYEVLNKILANFAKKALDNPLADFVLIIDEINRANLPAVLGELIYALEYRYDKENHDETTVESMYSLKSSESDSNDEEDETTETQETRENKELKLPKNLYIIGTMNTADRSVGHIDYAIRRRFAYVDILPSESVIDNVIEDKKVKDNAISLFRAVAGLFDKEFLAPDFKKNDVQIGHSYFLAKTEDELKLKLEYEIKPILREYLKDGILLEKATALVEGLEIK